jgi:sec-independent protein translocase protein TatB
MFDIGWSEMALILLVALIVIGPKDLPRVARTVGQWVGKGRAMAREFQRALEDMAREAELDKVKNEIEKAGRTNIGKTIEKSIDPSGELSKAFDPRADMAPTAAKRANGDPASGQPGPAPAATAPAAPTTPTPATPASTTPAPAGNGGVAPAAQKAAPAARKAAPATQKEAAAAPPPAAPAKRKRRAPAGNGAGGTKDASEPARAPAPAETS